MEQKHIYVLTAEQAVRKFVVDGVRLKKPEDVDERLLLKRGCFVSLHLENGDLRGCIGTIEPRFKTLFEEIVQNAISASSTDPRFRPVAPEELSEIKVSVDVLSPFEEVTPDQLDPAVYGLIISDGHRKGVLLPALESVDTVEKQIDIVKKKARLQMVDNDQLKFYRFRSERFE
ncbi:AmmeMemoRadiSam system protein A [Salinivirga cyanobacteriivorans]